jgi:hypothetical protein
VGRESTVKASGVSPAYARLFPASTLEETAEMEGTESHDQRGATDLAAVKDAAAISPPASICRWALPSVALRRVLVASPPSCRALGGWGWSCGGGR